MATALGNFHLSVFYTVNEPVCFINPTAPKSRQVARQRFRFSYAVVAVPVYVLYQLIDSFQGPSILFLPIEVIFPSFVSPHFIHYQDQSDRGPCPWLLQAE